MFKKTIKFKNFDDEEVSRDFYFHISKSEFIAMAGDGKTMQDRIKKIIATEDVAAVLEEFRALIKMSVGSRSLDGERFIKNEEAQSVLLDSPAFDELLFELISNAGAATDFVQQLIPEKMQKELKEQIEKSAADPFKDKEDTRPAYQREHRKPTASEMQSMTRDEMNLAWAFAEGLNK